MKKLSVLIGVILLVGCAERESPAAPKEMVAEPAAMQAPVAETQYGPVRGYREDEILVFKGVRYGADTAQTRFQAPATPAAWTEPQDATQLGNTCPQTPTGNPGGLFTSWRPDPAPALSEDCLFLNVWTQGLADGAKRPVMVWLHGGGFSSGSGSSRAYDGVRLAKRGDVVVVTINHRLNVFGYLALNHLGDEFADAPVAGVLDMVLALEWVRDNIAGFGGDPETVMIFGESGGGAKVSTLLATERATGLFHRAVVQSGAMLQFPDAERAQAAADEVIANLGIETATLAELQALSMEAISAAAQGTSAGGAPTIDGKTLTRHAFLPDAAPQGKDVPLLLGTTRTESSLFVGAADPTIFDIDWPGVVARLTEEYPDLDAQAVVDGYRAIDANLAPADVYFEATTDARWLAGHVTQAELRVAQGGADTYQYLFNWNTPVDGGQWRSPHALEIGFVFDNVAYSESFSGVGAEQQQVADQMADAWIAFARTGNPNHAGLPDWPAYNLDDRPVMVFDVQSQLQMDARGAQRRLIDDSSGYGNRYQR